MKAALITIGNELLSGFTVNTNASWIGLELGKIGRRRFPKSLIICGGNVATTMYKEVYQDDLNVFDALCYGEGERPISELIESKNILITSK